MSLSGSMGATGIDVGRAVGEIRELGDQSFVDSYDEFVCGSWRTCLLRNASGRGRDAEVRDYQGSAVSTPYESATPYLRTFIDEHFDTNRLRFARLTRLSPGSVVVPHCDYVELERPLVRIHIPLVTHPHAYASESSTVYHMDEGSAWFLDATQVHSIANFSPTPRVHLLLDFQASAPRDVFRDPGRHQEPRIPADLLIERRSLSVLEQDALRGLGGLVDSHNLPQVLALLIKKYFVTETDIVSVFDWLDEIAAASGDADVEKYAQWLRAHALVSRSDVG